MDGSQHGVDLVIVSDVAVRFGPVALMPVLLGSTGELYKTDSILEFENLLMYFHVIDPFDHFQFEILDRYSFDVIDAKKDGNMERASSVAILVVKVDASGLHISSADGDDVKMMFSLILLETPHVV